MDSELCTNYNKVSLILLVLCKSWSWNKIEYISFPAAFEMLITLRRTVLYITPVSQKVFGSQGTQYVTSIQAEIFWISCEHVQSSLIFQPNINITGFDLVAYYILLIEVNPKASEDGTLPDNQQ